MAWPPMTPEAAVVIHGRSSLHRIRPRFVYLWVRLWAIPIPIFLFAPLVMLEFFLMLSTQILHRSKTPDRQINALLQALRAPTRELRKMPPFVLLEAEVRSRAFDVRAPQQVYVKMGLW